MNVYKYRINNEEYLFPEEIYKIVKEDDVIECGLFEVRPAEGNKLLYTVFPYVYKNGFFMKSVYDVGYKRLNVYYPKLPKDPYTEMVSRYVDQKMWCPVQ